MNAVGVLELLQRSPLGRELLGADPTARLVDGPPGIEPRMALAQVACENRCAGGLAQFRKALVQSRPTLKPGTDVGIADGRTGTFLADVGNALAYVNVDGFVFLLPYDALHVLESEPESLSVEIGGQQGGFEGHPAFSRSISPSISLEAEKGWLSSPQGQLDLAKATITRSPAPGDMGFERSDLAGARFARGDRVLHRPTGRRAKFIAAQSGTHSHIVFDDGSSLTCANDELEHSPELSQEISRGISGEMSSEEIPQTGLAAHPALPPFHDSGRRNLVGSSADYGAKAADFASPEGQAKLAKLIVPASPAADLLLPTRPAGLANESESFEQARARFDKLWQEYLRNHPEAGPSSSRLLAKGGSSFAVGSRVRHPNSGIKGWVLSVDGHWVKVYHDGGGTMIYDSAELEPDSAQPPLRRDYSRMEYGGYSNVVPRRY